MPDTVFAPLGDTAADQSVTQAVRAAEAALARYEVAPNNRLHLTAQRAAGIAVLAAAPHIAGGAAEVAADAMAEMVGRLTAIAAEGLAEAEASISADAAVRRDAPGETHGRAAAYRHMLDALGEVLADVGVETAGSA